MRIVFTYLSNNKDRLCPKSMNLEVVGWCNLEIFAEPFDCWHWISVKFYFKLSRLLFKHSARLNFFGEVRWSGWFLDNNRDKGQRCSGDLREGDSPLVL